MIKARNAGRELAIYDGQQHVASITDDDPGCTLYDALGNVLGRYESRREAMRAMRDLMPPARVEDRQ